MSPAKSQAEITLTGIPASPGVAVGPVYVMPRGFAAPEVYEIDPAQVPAEQERFAQAIELTKRQLEELQSRLENMAGGEPASIFEVHTMLLTDPASVTRVRHGIATLPHTA